MRQRVRRSLSFSNLVALVALFFALGGTVYAAGLISGSQIKPKSIPANRIKPKSLGAKQLKAGSITGAQIKAGSLTGAQVNGSTLTGVSAAAIGSVQYVATTVTLPEGGTLTPGTVACPEGTKAIGGGAVTSDEDGHVNDTAPAPAGAGWFAKGYAFGDGSTMTITAICTVVTNFTG